MTSHKILRINFYHIKICDKVLFIIRQRKGPESSEVTKTRCGCVYEFSLVCSFLI